MDLTTNYLGLTLEHPYVAGASPLNFDIESAREIQRGGAAAIVMPSLASDQLAQEHEALSRLMEIAGEGHPEAEGYFSGSADSIHSYHDYLEHVKALKAELSIPVIGSISGGYASDWLHYVPSLAEAGADAVELNLYDIPVSGSIEGRELEDRLLGRLEELKRAVSIPIAVKLAPYFTALPHFAARLEATGVEALVLFNRFYHVDIDIDELELVKSYSLSGRDELPLRLLWTAILSTQRGLDLALTGGVHTVEDGIKALMAGATVVQMTSVVLSNGAAQFDRMASALRAWMQDKEYDALGQLRGSMNISRCPQPELFTHINHFKELSLWWGTRAPEGNVG